MGAEPGTGASGNVITAENLSFDRDTLSFPADTASTLTFQNNDAGVPHNVAIYPDASSSKALFTGDLVTGVDTATYDIPALPAGSYYFHCDVHPDMHGTVTVGTRRAPARERPPPSGSGPRPPKPAPPSGVRRRQWGRTTAQLAFDPTSCHCRRDPSTSRRQPGRGRAHASIYTDDFTGDRCSPAIS